MQDNQQASHFAVPSSLFAVTPYRQQQQNVALQQRHGSSQHPHKLCLKSFGTNWTTYLCILFNIYTNGLFK